MEAALKAMSDAGPIGGMLVVSLLANAWQYRDMNAMHKANRESDKSNMERLHEALKMLHDVSNSIIGRGRQGK